MKPPEWNEVEEWHLVDKIKIHRWLTRMLKKLKGSNYCPECYGEGRIDIRDGMDTYTEQCSSCNGSGIKENT